MRETTKNVIIKSSNMIMLVQEQIASVCLMLEDEKHDMTKECKHNQGFVTFITFYADDVHKLTRTH
jgi:hypothetical protein